MGSLPELGEWNTIKCRLQWTEGHLWTLPEPLILKGVRTFSYKYVIVDGTDNMVWEQGVDRIADLT